MITKKYLFDLLKWEVLILAENPENDVRVGIFDTVMEANKAMRDYNKSA